jgi:hypothetical protein
MKKLLLASAALMLAASANAGPTYGFACITSNNPVDCASGAGQLTMEVIDEGAGLVSFLFENAVGDPMSITDVYFDEDLLLNPIFAITSSAGVAFSSPATPGDLPGGNSISPAFVTSLGLSVDSDPPVAPNGVDSSTEWLRLTFGLLGTNTYSNVISDLATDDLRVGLHIQAFEGGGSESFVNGPPNNPPPPPPPPAPVPEPGTLVLLGSGLAFVARRFHKR